MGEYKRVQYTGSRHPELMNEFGTAIRRGTRLQHITVQWDNGCECEVFEQDLMILEPAHDPVNQPQHYASGEVECIDAIRASMSKEAFCGYLKGNVQKYMWRYEKKINPVEDIKKARWYSERLIKELEDA